MPTNDIKSDSIQHSWAIAKNLMRVECPVGHATVTSIAPEAPICTHEVDDQECGLKTTILARGPFSFDPDNADDESKLLHLIEKIMAVRGIA